MNTIPTSTNNSIHNMRSNSSRSRTSGAWGILFGVALVGVVWGTPVASASSIWKGSSAAAKSKADIKGNNKDNNNNKLADSTASTTANSGTSDEPWRARKEWWKDPLALFNENDELIDPLDPEDSKTPASKSGALATEVEVDENFILPVEDEPVPTIAIKAQAPKVESVPEVPEPPAAVAVPVAVTAAEESQHPTPVPPAVVSVETAVAPAAAQVEVHAIPQPQGQQPAPLGSATPAVPNVEAAVVTQHSFDSVRTEPPATTASPTSTSTIPAVATPATGPMAVLPAVSTTLAASTSLSSQYNNNNPYAGGINVGSMLSNIPAVKVLAVLAIGKAIITGIALPPPGIPSTENDWEALSSSSSSNSKNRKDDADKSSRRRDSDITVAAAATNNMLMSSSSSSQGGWTRQLTTWFGLRRTNEEDAEKLPSARELMDEVEILRKRAETAEQERQIMEREYEKTSWQLQEAQNELSSLTSTTRYLKAQLRDNEEMMDRAIRAERRKAKEELLRLKDAMLEVVERERQAMRDELTRQAEEVQALLRDGATTKNSYPA